MPSVTPSESTPSPASAETTPAARRIPKAFWGGLAILLAVAYMVFTAAQSSSAYYLTVAEARTQGANNRTIRVAGLAAGESIQYSQLEGLVSFEIADDSGPLAVAYRGVPPDMLRDGADTVVEGRLGADGVFQADQIILKCPSKYEAAP